MKISSGASSASLRSGAVAPAEAIAENAAAGAVTPGSSAGEQMQSAVLQPAMAALRAMPEIDHERVAMLRDALAKGELPFDPSKLAGLIQRFHGGES
ncbi:MULTISPECIES: flagellar biosynthesis anti-sigma factor FlgM [unclassified Janthinobacterium]|uniref:flagellar biosynthesis anti-sigma factor FlgM n=1 Tax=unclassified Janthinobacterium TaxID=2610881 RepID=UPI00161D24BE|nr:MULTISPECIES: flagellar biosynthesis anti-sigma factor FlgM [unclassified Janthinobacterium]MBB5366640.1 negative regulator of flagellin synthesis FlgM [Janthinobacterium sp. K2C7]MBB5380882.1 negative regulator of flagellin synthesis FlgM [Janthinobacterium sp. K2Li3]MBB5385022.1 negative regulator of flagellin synthesis FlgM [Janthinobacterium sp. K2E3]